MNVADYEMRFDALKAMERSMSGNFEKKPELQKVQRESNDASLGVIRAAVSRSYTVEWRPLHQSDTPLASIRDLEAARRGNLMPFKSMRCPTSPLCLQCEWPQRRSWLLCLLKKLKMPTKVVKLVLGFARQHRPVRAVDLPPRTELRVRWWDPLEENVTQEEQEQESNKGRAGTVTCEYYDPASLAMELHAMTMYPIDDFKMLRGGVLHLVGEFQLFWSAVLNFADFHSCAPLEGLYKWGETVPRLEYRRMCQCLQSGSPKMQSRSRFALLMCRELCSGADELNRTLPPCAYTELDDEAVTPGEPIARWWHDATHEWDRVLTRMFEGNGEPEAIGCYYYCFGGCAAAVNGPDERCPYWHDSLWGAHAHACISCPRICGFCGDYADELRCGACKMRFYCSDVCQKEEWKYHKAECRRVR
ncbi:Kinase D-interacting substrate of 220 kDa [Durusdinium trenchii]|uniref:Kinase D-interacting substrate of 220 kDa n=1 Tax=Durusdinium trenchii TaxID=1381693 RepID=A0ABP0Q9A1_9DINO